MGTCFCIYPPPWEICDHGLLFSNNGLHKIPWKSFTSDLHTKLKIISRSAPGLTNDSHAVFGGVDEPFSSCIEVNVKVYVFIQLVCTLGIAEMVFLLISNPYSCLITSPDFAYHFSLKWFVLWNNFFVDVVSTLSYYYGIDYRNLYDNRSARQKRLSSYFSEISDRIDNHFSVKQVTGLNI